MLSLVTTTSALARITCVLRHYVCTNNAKVSGHYVRQRTHNVHAHALCSDQTISIGFRLFTLLDIVRGKEVTPMDYLSIIGYPKWSCVHPAAGLRGPF